jgi:hypothetical protein
MYSSTFLQSTHAHNMDIDRKLAIEDETFPPTLYLLLQVSDYFISFFATVTKKIKKIK